jgi:hypothetical protein
LVFPAFLIALHPVELQPTLEPRPDAELLAKTRATARELEEIKIRLKLMESRRSEDAERIMGLEARAIEAETRAQNFDKLRSELPFPADIFACL